MEDIRNIQINIEQDFWGDFVQEAYEHIEDIETNIIQLEENPNDMDMIHAMFRAYHTIKGLSGFVEHTIIQEIAHSTETMMDLCRKQIISVSPEVIDAILKSADFIKNLCNDIDSYKNPDFINAIEAHLKVLEKLANVDEQKQWEPETENKTEEVVESENIPQIGDSQAQETSSVELVQEQPVNEESSNAQVLNPEGLEELANMDLSDIVKPEEPENALEETNDISKAEDSVKTVVEEIKIEEPKAPPIPPVPEQMPPKLEVKPVPTPVTKAGDKKNAPANEEYMKVANSKIDYLVDMIGELIINQSLLEQHIESSYGNDDKLLSGINSFSSIARELQYLSMSLRMVSLKSTFLKITRIARDTIKELNKDVEFVTSGETTEIDRIVADKLLDPLVHLIKNAISHGVEVNAQDRVKGGKAKKARVELNAYNKRGKIFIEVKDDGKGVNREAVYNKALEKGIINPAITYSDAEIVEFIMLPGFSTAAVVDNISGRGVGMDVVKTQIQKIGGKVEIQSEEGKGSTFVLEVPVNHAIMNGTVVDINSHHFIIPTINVKEIIQPDESCWISTHDKTTMLKVREDIIPIIPHTILFPDKQPVTNSKLVVLLELDQELRALPITNVINRQEIVVKPVGMEFSNLKYIAGMSILGNGQVSLILDTDYLFKKEGRD